MARTSHGRSFATRFHLQALKAAMCWLWQDIDFDGIPLWAMALHAQHFPQSRRLDPDRLSCAGMLRAYRRAMREFKSRSEPGEDLHSMLLVAQKDSYQRTKPKSNEDFPPFHKPKPAGRPLLKNPTIWQIKRAKQLQQCGII